MITVLLAADALAAAEARIEGDAYRHLFRARRLAVGDRLRAVDGRGGARWASVTVVGRGGATLTLGEAAPTHEPPLALTLLVAAFRRERASWLVEKATELGVAAIRFLASERTPREFGAGTLARLDRVAAAALEQCHGARLPALSGVHPWAELPDLLAAAAPPDRRWVLDTGLAAPAPAAAFAPLAGTAEGGRAALLVGPEGGWTDGERGELAGHGAVAVTLGPRTLRVETAALAGTALALGLAPTRRAD
jgi:16S rRNA (uracil1498-N3)-methyltransferase